jgi:hypothetical protein
MIAPCVEVLRHLAKTMNSLLGMETGTRHEPVDLSHDIPELMASLNDHNVYREIVGRKLDDDDEPVVDIVTAGLQSLTDNSSNPLDEFNKAFVNLQAQRRLIPVVGGPLTWESTNQQPSTPSPPPTPSTWPIKTTDRNLESSSIKEDAESSDTESDRGGSDELSNNSEEDEDEAYTRAFTWMAEELEEPTLTRDRAEDLALDMDEDNHDNSDLEGSDDRHGDDTDSE